MADPFSKLFSSIVTSSVWLQPHHILRVWIFFVATKDETGIVRGVAPRLAIIAGVTLEEFEEATKVLESADPWSKDRERDDDADGRRIEKIPGGWHVVNHGYYRELRSEPVPSETPAAIRQRRRRARLAEQPVSEEGVTSRDIDRDSVTSRDRGVTERDSYEYESSSSFNSLDLEVREEHEKGDSPTSLDTRDAAADKLRADRDRRLGTFFGEFDFANFREPAEMFLRNFSGATLAGVLAELREHLTGEFGTRRKSSPRAVGLALQQYVAKWKPGEPFNSLYFGGFVQRATGHIGRQTEERRIETEKADELERRAEDTRTAAELDRRRKTVVEQFADQRPDEYRVIVEQAQASLPAAARGSSAWLASIVRGMVSDVVATIPLDQLPP